jgi:hypothetical protein
MMIMMMDDDDDYHDDNGGGAVDGIRIGRVNRENFPQATLSTTNST